MIILSSLNLNGISNAVMLKKKYYKIKVQDLK